MFVQWKGYTYRHTDRYLKEYKKQRSECGGGGAFTLLLHFMFFSNPGSSSSKVPLKAAAPPCHCWGPVGRREGCPGSAQLRPPLASATVLALGLSLGAAGIDWSGFPGGAGLSPGCLPQCHDHLQTTLGPAPLTCGPSDAAPSTAGPGGPYDLEFDPSDLPSTQFWFPSGLADSAPGTS